MIITLLHYSEICVPQTLLRDQSSPDMSLDMYVWYSRMSFSFACRPIISQRPWPSVCVQTCGTTYLHGASLRCGLLRRKLFEVQAP